MFNPLGEVIYSVIPLTLIKRVGPQCVGQFIAGKHKQDTLPDRMCNGEDGPLLLAPCCKALIQRRKICPLGAYGRMRELKPLLPQAGLGNTQPMVYIHWYSTVERTLVHNRMLDHS
jgi:hypothetical protein